MKKQDYETLARAIKNSLATAPDFCHVVHVETLARYLADNLHVNRATFLTACGLKP